MSEPPPPPPGRLASLSGLVPTLRRVPRPFWKYAEGLAPVVIVWLVLVGWLAAALYSRANWSEQADEATVREWLDEARIFRKTLPQLVADYAALADASPRDPQKLREKRDELVEQMRGLAEPTRWYPGQLPSFPVVYRLEVRLGGVEPVAWDSPLPRPRQQSQSRVRVIEYAPLAGDARATVRCEYQLHAFNKLQSREAERRRTSLVTGGVLVAATLLSGLFVALFLRRERALEVAQLTAQAEAEHAERELLTVRLRQREAEQVAADLDRKLLQQRLDAAGLEKRADEAEKTALEMRSQLYASIGIMAGSYAHNIKNLLVRPNDLLARCLEGGQLPKDQAVMLTEVRGTLGTVTERLQQILRTVKRDPSRSEMTRVDLAALARDTHATWQEMAREKWKLWLSAETPPGPQWVRGDLSHLQQAVENLVFNARDATFEMRNEQREAARSDATLDAPTRRQRLIDAASWRGEVGLKVYRDGDAVVLEVRDNGVGMTEAVQENCLRTHFTTKRDNALYEGYNAGMGLGLSFVAVVLEHHGATLSIDSAPKKGTRFVVRFPVPADEN